MTYFHEEQRFGWWISAIVLIALVVTCAMVLIALATTAQRAPAFALVVLPLIFSFVMTLFAFAKLDVDVDDGGIDIAFHWLWPTRRIPLDDVKRAHATEYSPLAWGGWGVHYMILRGWSFNTGGNEGVLVETKSGPRIMIGSQRAKELDAAIATAIAARRVK
jgi:hypothetical protein